jgi:nitroimidazol reductase NimA-like FMN-containing flavoprotein (pyridoxamine 5'-phosphate oxidase superfamily)
MTSRRPTGDEASRLVEDATALLDAHDTMSLAVCGADGPWICKAFFVEDEPRPGSLDLCCSLVMGADLRGIVGTKPRVAFIVAGETPDRWVTGRGVAEQVSDDADSDAIVKRLTERIAAAGPFLHTVDHAAVRIHVERLTVTAPAADPPVTEFTFA